MELKVIQPIIKNIKKAEIEFNSEELRSYLDESLHMYGKLAVTADTVKDAKKTCADLNKLSNAIDSFRKKTKKELSENIAKFETEVKEIKSLVDNTYQPIKSQIDHFIELQRKEKKKDVNAVIDAVKHEHEVRDEFYNLEFDDSWLNSSMSLTKVKEAVTAQFEMMKVLQYQHDMKIDTITSILSAYNEKLRYKFTVIEFEHMLANHTVTEISDHVKKVVNARVEEEAEELKRIEQEKLEAVEQAKREAEAEAEKARLQEEANHKAELERAEFEKQQALLKAEHDKAVSLFEATEAFEEFIPVEEVEEVEELTVKYQITASKEKLDALEKYLEQFEFSYQLIF